MLRPRDEHAAQPGPEVERVERAARRQLPVGGRAPLPQAHQLGERAESLRLRAGGRLR
ncbi:MAG: hypothetical protein U5L08_06405 [Xanthomonadales bacterium]|nr:hypothetical protein [Xanthomonadales bacterium]